MTTIKQRAEAYAEEQWGQSKALDYISRHAADDYEAGAKAELALFAAALLERCRGAAFAVLGGDNRTEAAIDLSDLEAAIEETKKEMEEGK